MYQAIFSRRAERAFLALSDKEARRVKEAIDQLKENPRIRGTIKLENAPAASYRHRVGDISILFDLDEDAKVIEILDIRKRDEQTYKRC